MIRDLSHAILLSAAPLANHLWQSTVFALLAACLTLFLKENPARLRFTIWFVASVKFLVPFALLVQLGQFLSAKTRASSPQFFVSVLEVASEPFSHGTAPVVLHAAWRGKLLAAAPLLLAALWLAGCLVIFSVWCLGWRGVSRIRKAGKPIHAGPEIKRLRLLESMVGIEPLPILLSQGRFEPGVFGIMQPALLWPEGISNELQEPGIDAILAHEVWHARRHDNLLAAVQMLVQAIFWFHPLVWWLGSRQMEEREHACDEGVLELGSDPAVYAEGLLKACRFCAAFPLPCVAGVNGSNLKKRIVLIMKHEDMKALSMNRKLVLGSLALVAITAPLLSGFSSSSEALAQARSSQTSSEPLRITSLTRSKPGESMTLVRHTAQGTLITHASVKELIEMAYALKDYQLTGGPSWINQDRFDITYTGGEQSGSAGSLVSNADLKGILIRRFHLVLSEETKAGPSYALVVGGGGTKFAVANPPHLPGSNEPILNVRVLRKDGQGTISITGGPGSLADTLSAQVGRPIVNRTGLKGIYNIDFHWATAASADGISEGLKQQLGLALIPEEGPVETAVIQSVNLPTES